MGEVAAQLDRAHGRPEATSLRSVPHPLRALALLVFLAALLFFVLTASGHIQTIDVNQSKALSQQIVAHGQVAITGFPTTPAGGAVIGTGGHAYAEHDIGLAVIFLPISAALQWHWISPSTAEFLYPLVNPLFGAAMIAIFFLFTWLLTVRLAVSAVSAALFGLTTILWPYAHSSFDVLPAGFFILASVYLLFASSLRRKKLGVAPLLAGLAAGAAILVRIDSVLIVGVESLLLVGLHWRSTGRTKVQVATSWLAPLAVAAAVTLWYNHARFGSWLNNGHRHDPLVAFSTPIWDGFLGQLLSPGKGIVFFTPTLLIALAGWWLLRRQEPVLVMVVGAAVLSYVLFHSGFNDWSGSAAWGPRFVVPVIGLMMLPLGVVLARWRELGVWAKTTVVITSVIGFLVQVIGVTTDDLGVALMHSGGNWTSSQILNGWRTLNQALHGVEPYSAAKVKGALPVPVPHFNFWWAGWAPARAATGLIVSVLASLLVMAIIVGVIWVRRQTPHSSSAPVTVS